MNPFKGLFCFFLISLALGASGCATSESALMVPVRPSPMRTLKRVPDAKLRIPLVVALPKMEEMEKHLAQFVKDDWKKAEKSLSKSLGTTVWWDPLDWDSDGNTMTARMQVHYKVPDKENPGQEIEKDLKVDLASALKWTEDWHLEAPSFKDEEGTKDEDTDEAKGKKILQQGTAKFHEILKAKSDFRSKAKELWKKIQEPIRVGEDIWLQILPHSVSVGDSHIVLDKLSPRMETVLEIIAQPNVIFGHKPAPLNEDLPPLTDFKRGPDGFHAQSNLKVSFKEVNKLLASPKAGIIGKPLPGSSDKNIKLTGLRLYGSGGQVVVEAQVEYQPVLNLSSKPSKLTVYLLGTPEYHEKEQVIDFPDLDFDVKSDDFLVQMATFIDGDGMKEQLREKAVIPVGKNMDELKGYLVKMLNRPLGGFARLKTTVSSFRMEEAIVTDYGIEGRVSLDGDADVVVNW